MTHLSSATARALKAAGFPQPQPMRGQRWISPNGITWIIDGELDKIHVIQDTYGFTYVPTAQDILFTLPYGCSVSKSVLGFQVKHQHHEQDFELYSGPTLAEALATAYLALSPTPAP